MKMFFPRSHTKQHEEEIRQDSQDEHTRVEQDF